MTGTDWMSNVEASLDHDALQRRIFAGEVLIFKNRPAMTEINDRAADMIADAFPDIPPLAVQDALPPEEFLPRAKEMRRRFMNDPEIQGLYRRALEECGVSAETTYWEPPRLRVNPSGATHHDRRIRNLPPHRDSWGSMLPQQINWWAPVFPIDEDRTVILFPHYWNSPIENDSAYWDLRELRRLRAEGRAGDYPLLATVTPNGVRELEGNGSILPILAEPGDLVAFSAAHLHASAENRSGLARYNTEVRTVDSRMIGIGLGAPDPDGAAPCKAFSWFRNVIDGHELTPPPGMEATVQHKR